MLAVINATLVFPNRMQPESYLLAEDGKITACGHMADVPVLTGWEVYDAKGPPPVEKRHYHRAAHLVLQYEP